ncbi:MAG: MFS transporter, partial [Sphingomonadaceae bacterium]
MVSKFAEGRMLAYASGNFGKALVFSGADLTILFLLTDLLGVSAMAAGSLMLFALCGDLVFDLLAARLVIRMRHHGRGYRWMVAVAAVPCGLAFALLYAMPALGLREIWALAAALLVFRGAYAMIDVPHNALMAQITSDSQARGRVSGYRLFFSTASALALATILTPLVQQAGKKQAFDTLAATGMIAGLLFVITMIACALMSRDGAGRPVAHAPCEDGIAIPLRDPMVVAMALLAFLTGFAVPAFGRMLLYIGSYVVARPDLVPTLLLALTVGQFAGVLVWTAMTGRFSKSHLLAMGHGVSALGLILFALCLPWPDALIGCAVLIGFGLASVYMLPWGLLADAVDVVAWRNGRRFETGLFAYY